MEQRVPKTNPTVLVIEDDPAYRELAQEALRGYTRWFATNAHEGIERFCAESPDVVFLDLSLPDDNGLEVLLEIREEQPDAYVVILTSSRTGEDVAMARRCAANGYIVKPFSRRQLQLQCEAGMEHHQRVQQMHAVAREAFLSRQRATAQRMRSILHAPDAPSRAAVQAWISRWPVLVVGASTQGALQWQQELEAAGCPVTRIERASQAFQHVQAVEDGYRLLIIEEDLPDSDAAELLYRLRVNRIFIPALVVVDAAWKQRQPKWRKVGAQRVLRGPLPDGYAVMMVEKAIARSQGVTDDIFLQ